MHGDILLIKDTHVKAAKNIAEIIFNNITGNEIEKFVVAISGESGCGKSEVAHMISYFLKEKGILAKLLHMDNYYVVPSKERHELRKKRGLDSINYDEYNWDLIKKHIKEFRESSISVLPFLDLLTDQMDKLITDFKGINVLIMEGLYSIYCDYGVDLKIFIDLDYTETKKAQMLRRKEKFDEFRLKVLEREHEVVQMLKPKADLIITKNFDVIESDDAIL
jgi:uridine kinase